MVPRGEVGLVFANIGLALSIGGRRIIDEATFSAVVVMVIVTGRRLGLDRRLLGRDALVPWVQ